MLAPCFARHIGERVGHDAAIVQTDDPARVAHHHLVVGREDERRVVLAVQLFHKFKDILARMRVEVRRRLVREYDGRLLDEGARYRDTLLLAAGHFHRAAVFHPGKADLGENREHPLVDLQVAQALHELKRKRDVLARGENGNQVIALEDKTDFLLARQVPLPAAEPRELLPVEGDLARADRIEATDQIEERRLPRARRPGEREKLALTDLERDAPKRLDFLHAGVVHLRDLVDRYHFSVPLPARKPASSDSSSSRYSIRASEPAFVIVMSVRGLLSAKYFSVEIKPASSSVFS